MRTNTYYTCGDYERIRIFMHGEDEVLHYVSVNAADKVIHIQASELEDLAKTLLEIAKEHTLVTKPHIQPQA
jgi:predicted AlkP superfamily phosphohydrolase/phosphomutase